ncbi:MAG: hypothetical protein M3Y21_05890 [Candidatus Eremiobacteraeota bacterium]|nr:hypothetical protein [Candidatus Eremiobacteraeota bacterium]
MIAVTGEYTLARLEFCLHHPKLAPPPVIARLPEASEESLRERWESIERQVEAALGYAKQIESRRSSVRKDPAFAWLRRTLKELDQYARAIRWVMTVSERG